MERRSMWSRLLAIVLAVSMVFSSQSMSVFADTLAIIQQPQDTNEKKNQPADDTSKDNQETSEESEEETTAAEEPQQSEPAEESSEAQQEQTVQMTGTINGENVNLRSEPSTSSEVLSKAQTGDVVSILGEVTGDDGNTWYEILYGQGSAFVSAEFVTVEETAEEESEEEKPAKAAKKAARNAEGEAEDSKTTEDELKALADSYFLEKGDKHQDMLDVSISRVDTKGDQIKAGDTLTYSISYKTYGSPVFSYPSGQVLTMFDEYLNTEIRLLLPGRNDLGRSRKYSRSIEEPTPDPSTGEWIFKLNTSLDAQKDGNGSFQINVKLDVNGTAPVGKVYQFAQEALKMYTEIPLKNKMNVGSSQEIERYKYWEKETPSNTVTTTTSDEWIVEKEPVGKAEFNGDNMTVNFLVKVGLKNSSYAIDNPAAYGVNGRVPFVDADPDTDEVEVTLGEILSVTGQDGAATTITPKKVIVKQNFDQEEYTFGDGGTYSLSDLSSFKVEMDVCEGKTGLAGKVAGTAPYYSTYSVTAIYDASDFTVSYKDDQRPWTVKNQASFTYQLAGTDESKTSSDDAEVTAIHVTDPAQLTIEKYITDYLNSENEVLYSSASSGQYDSQVTGPATFSITKKDGSSFQIYQKGADGRYQALSEQESEVHEVTIDPQGTGDTNSTDGSMTVYLDPGEYTITETKDPLNTELSKIDEQESIVESKAVSVTAGTETTVRFLQSGNPRRS